MLDIIYYLLFDALILEPLIAPHVGLLIYAFSSKRRELMSAWECLQNITKNKPNSVVTIGTIQNGEAEWHVFGENCVELEQQAHTYEIASITKTMTGALVARAKMDGKLRLDDPIDMYLDLPHDRQYPTVRDLLTHTSGYKSIYIEKEVFKTIQKTRNILSGVNRDILLRRLESIETKKKRRWRYSNFNFAVLGVILENVYRVSYQELVTDFLREHNLRHTHLSNGTGDLDNYLGWHRDDVYMAGGAVTSDIKDMLAYAQLQLEENELFGKTHKVLKNVKCGPELCATRNAMGYGWMIDREKGFYWHNGATPGYRTYIGVCPETQTAVVVLANSNRSLSSYHMESNLGAKILEEMQMEYARV